jgi:hypothetical protein
MKLRPPPPSCRCDARWLPKESEMRLLLPLLIATAACAPIAADGQSAQGEPAAPVASAPAWPAPAPTGQCDAAPAQFAVGQSYSADLAERARAAAGAAVVRRLVPGQVVTMEFNGARLNLDTDATGKVTSARCG